MNDLNVEIISNFKAKIEGVEINYENIFYTTQQLINDIQRELGFKPSPSYSSSLVSDINEAYLKNDYFNFSDIEDEFSRFIKDYQSNNFEPEYFEKFFEHSSNKLKDEVFNHYSEDLELIGLQATLESKKIDLKKLENIASNNKPLIKAVNKAKDEVKLDQKGLPTVDNKDKVQVKHGR